MRSLVLAIVLLARPLDAQQLIISAGGRRVVDHDSLSAAANCQAVSAAPMPIADDLGEVSMMYTVGGWYVDWCQQPLMSPDRFGDRIWMHVRRYGDTWSSPEASSSDSGRIVLDRSSFPWMEDARYLSLVPEAHVGHLASPSVVKANGRYYMAFTASVDDRNLCAAEHDDEPTTCGSCSDPWSYMVMMWATSDDGIHWKVRDPDGPALRNRALTASVLRMLPQSSDRLLGSKFKGVTQVSMVLGVEEDAEEPKMYFYLAARVWGRNAIRPALIRIPFDPEAEEGLGGAPEIWNANFARWEECPSGDAPRWLLDTAGKSLTTLGWPSTIAWTSAIPGYRFIALFVANSYNPTLPGMRGLQNTIMYQLSNDLIEWSHEVTIRSAVPLFADGHAYDYSILDPVYVEDHFGTPRMFFASADGDPGAGIDRDGRYDCALGQHSTAIYVGTGIYEAILDFKNLYRTETILTSSLNPATPGDRIQFTVRIGSNSPVWPVGTVTLRDGITDLGRAPLVNGRAEFDIVFPTSGLRVITAEFEGESLFDKSRSPRLHQVVGPAKRRGARR
ncbi:MAG TPA: Ig-like domain repeat protein [Thermoanaerobaculia bacterium]